MFLDIETAPQWEKLNEAPANVIKEWVYKFKFRDDAPKKPSEDPSSNAYEHTVKRYFDYFANLWEAQAGLYAEFSKVICISAGYMDGYNFKLKSYSHENEGDLLASFAVDLTAFNNHNKYLKLCAHYGKGFDFSSIRPFPNFVKAGKRE